MVDMVPMSGLVLGPLLRHVGAGRRDRLGARPTSPARSRSCGCREPHLRGRRATTTRWSTSPGLEPGARHARTRSAWTASVVWPPPDCDPPSAASARSGDDRGLRIAFGSCRYATRRAAVHADKDERPRRPRARRLRALALRMRARRAATGRDLLLLLGDQVYADETSPSDRRRSSGAARDIDGAPGRRGRRLRGVHPALPRVVERPDDPLAAVDACRRAMIFDDHDVRDDWNTSRRLARRRCSAHALVATSGSSAASSSYWVYQHLGNLSPERAAPRTTLYQRGARPPTATPSRCCATSPRRADREADGAKGARGRYRRDFGRRAAAGDRLARAAGCSTDGRRAMVDDDEFDWIEEQARAATSTTCSSARRCRGCSPRALHDLESWNEALCDGARGRALARLGERLRRAVDLEHWAAFRRLVRRALAALLGEVGRGGHGGRAPATICVLSGDVHHAYVAEAALPRAGRPRGSTSSTCSPLHNYVPGFMKVAFRIVEPPDRALGALRTSGGCPRSRP